MAKEEVEGESGRSDWTGWSSEAGSKDPDDVTCPDPTAKKYPHLEEVKGESGRSDWTDWSSEADSKDPDITCPDPTAKKYPCLQEVKGESGRSESTTLRRPSDAGSKNPDDVTCPDPTAKKYPRLEEVKGELGRSNWTGWSSEAGSKDPDNITCPDPTAKKYPCLEEVKGESGRSNWTGWSSEADSKDPDAITCPDPTPKKYPCVEEVKEELGPSESTTLRQPSDADSKDPDIIAGPEPTAKGDPCLEEVKEEPSLSKSTNPRDWTGQSSEGWSKERILSCPDVTTNDIISRDYCPKEVEGGSGWSESTNCSNLTAHSSEGGSKKSDVIVSIDPSANRDCCQVETTGESGGSKSTNPRDWTDLSSEECSKERTPNVSTNPDPTAEKDLQLNVSHYNCTPLGKLANSSSTLSDIGHPSISLPQTTPYLLENNSLIKKQSLIEHSGNCIPTDADAQDIAINSTPVLCDTQYNEFFIEHSLLTELSSSECSSLRNTLPALDRTDANLNLESVPTEEPQVVDKQSELPDSNSSKLHSEMDPSDLVQGETIAPNSRNAFLTKSNYKSNESSDLVINHIESDFNEIFDNIKDQNQILSVKSVEVVRTEHAKFPTNFFPPESNTLQKAKQVENVENSLNVKGTIEDKTESKDCGEKKICNESNVTFRRLTEGGGVTRGIAPASKLKGSLKRKDFQSRIDKIFEALSKKTASQATLNESKSKDKHAYSKENVGNDRSLEKLCKQDESCKSHVCDKQTLAKDRETLCSNEEKSRVEGRHFSVDGQLIQERNPLGLVTSGPCYPEGNSLTKLEEMTKEIKLVGSCSKQLANRGISARFDDIPLQTVRPRNSVPAVESTIITNASSSETRLAPSKQATLNLDKVLQADTELFLSNICQFNKDTLQIPDKKEPNNVIMQPQIFTNCSKLNVKESIFNNTKAMASTTDEVLQADTELFLSNKCLIFNKNLKEEINLPFEKHSPLVTEQKGNSLKYASSKELISNPEILHLPVNTSKQLTVETPNTDEILKADTELFLSNHNFCSGLIISKRNSEVKKERRSDLSKKGLSSKHSSIDAIAEQLGVKNKLLKDGNTEDAKKNVIGPNLLCHRVIKNPNDKNQFVADKQVEEESKLNTPFQSVNPIVEVNNGKVGLYEAGQQKNSVSCYLDANADIGLQADIMKVTPPLPLEYSMLQQDMAHPSTQFHLPLYNRGCSSFIDYPPEVMVNSAAELCPPLIQRNRTDLPLPQNPLNFPRFPLDPGQTLLSKETLPTPPNVPALPKPSSKLVEVHYFSGSGDIKTKIVEVPDLPQRSHSKPPSMVTLNIPMAPKEKLPQKELYTLQIDTHNDKRKSKVPVKNNAIVTPVLKEEVLRCPFQKKNPDLVVPSETVYKGNKEIDGLQTLCKQVGPPLSSTGIVSKCLDTAKRTADPVHVCQVLLDNKTESKTETDKQPSKTCTAQALLNLPKISPCGSEEIVFNSTDLKVILVQPESELHSSKKAALTYESDKCISESDRMTETFPEDSVDCDSEKQDAERKSKVKGKKRGSLESVCEKLSKLKEREEVALADRCQSPEIVLFPKAEEGEPQAVAASQELKKVLLKNRPSWDSRPTALVNPFPEKRSHSPSKPLPNLHIPQIGDRMTKADKKSAKKKGTSILKNKRKKVVGEKGKTEGQVVEEEGESKRLLVSNVASGCRGEVSVQLDQELLKRLPPGLSIVAKEKKGHQEQRDAIDRLKKLGTDVSLEGDKTGRQGDRVAERPRVLVAPGDSTSSDRPAIRLLESVAVVHDVASPVLTALGHKESKPKKKSVSLTAEGKEETDKETKAEQTRRDRGIFMFREETCAKTEGTEAIWICDICSASYNNSNALKKHYLRLHITKACLSEKDVESFNIDSEGEEGVEKTLTFKCHICKQMFEKKSELKSHHEKEHVAESNGVTSESKPCGQYICSRCETVFRRRKLYIKHKKVCKEGETEVDGPSHHCLYCNETFFTAYRKKNHILSNHPYTRRKHICVFCNKIFHSNNMALFIHLIVEHSSVYFGCRNCKERFLNVDELKTHFTKQHPEEWIPIENATSQEKDFYKCEKCERMFLMESCFKKHECSGFVDQSKDKILREKRPKAVLMERRVERTRLSGDTDFYSRVSTNVRDNLLYYLDGKLEESDPAGPSSPPSSRTILNFSAAVPPAVVSNESRLEPTDLKSHVPPTWEKFTFPKEYDGRCGLTSYIKDTSYLDLSTQLIMRRNLQRLNLLPEKEETRDDVPAVLALERLGAQCAESFGIKPNPPGDGGDVGELSGEWVRERTYVCSVCRWETGCLWTMEDHKYNVHPHVWCPQHEIIGPQHKQITSIVYKRLIDEDRGISSQAQTNNKMKFECTKCGQDNMKSQKELHRHMVECAGEDLVMLEALHNAVVVRPSSSRRRARWRGGSRRTRQGLKRNIPTTPPVHQSKKVKKLLRTKPGDSETIEKMIANLPAKRASRRVLGFDEVEIKTRSQATIQNVASCPVVKKNKPNKSEKKVLDQPLIDTSAENGDVLSSLRMMPVRKSTDAASLPEDQMPTLEIEEEVAPVNDGEIPVLSPAPAVSTPTPPPAPQSFICGISFVNRTIKYETPSTISQETVKVRSPSVLKIPDPTNIKRSEAAQKKKRGRPFGSKTKMRIKIGPKRVLRDMNRDKGKDRKVSKDIQQKVSVKDLPVGTNSKLADVFNKKKRKRRKSFFTRQKKHSGGMDGKQKEENDNDPDNEIEAVEPKKKKGRQEEDSKFNENIKKKEFEVVKRKNSEEKKEEQRKKVEEEKKIGEDKKKTLEEEKKRKIEEDKKKKEEEKKHKLEEEKKKKLEEEKKKKADEDKKKKLEDEKKKKLEEEKKKKVDEERKKKAEEEKKRKEEEERQRKDEEERQRKEEESKKKSQEERKRKVEEEKRKKFEEERKKKLEEEKKKKAEEERKRKVEEERRRKVEEERKKKEEEERKRKFEEEKKKKEEEKKRKIEEEHRKRFEEKQEELKIKMLEEEIKRQKEGEMKRILEEEQRKKFEEEAIRKKVAEEVKLEMEKKLEQSKIEDERRRMELGEDDCCSDDSWRSKGKERKKKELVKKKKRLLLKQLLKKRKLRKVKSKKKSSGSNKEVVKMGGMKWEVECVAGGGSGEAVDWPVEPQPQLQLVPTACLQSVHPPPLLSNPPSPAPLPWRDTTPSLGTILDSVNTLLSEPEMTYTPLGLPQYSLADLQKAMGASDAEMAVLQQLGEASLHMRGENESAARNAEEEEWNDMCIMDLDKQEVEGKYSSKIQGQPSTPAIKPVSSQATPVQQEEGVKAGGGFLGGVLRKKLLSGGGVGGVLSTPSVPVSSTPSSSTNSLLAAHPGKEVVCPTCSSHFMGFPALQQHITKFHSPQHNDLNNSGGKLKSRRSSTQKQDLSLLNTRAVLEAAKESRLICFVCQQILPANLMSSHLFVEHSVNATELSKCTSLSGMPGCEANMGGERLKNKMSSALGDLLDRAVNNLLTVKDGGNNRMSGGAIQLLNRLCALRKRDGAAQHRLHPSAKEMLFKLNAKHRLEEAIVANLGTEVGKKMKTKRHVCGICGASFMWETSWKEHVVSAHTKPDSAITSTPPEEDISDNDDKDFNNQDWRESGDEDCGSDGGGPDGTTGTHSVSALVPVCSDCGLGFKSISELMSHRSEYHTPGRSVAELAPAPSPPAAQPKFSTVPSTEMKEKEKNENKKEGKGVKGGRGGGRGRGRGRGRGVSRAEGKKKEEKKKKKKLTRLSEMGEESVRQKAEVALRELDLCRKMRGRGVLSVGAARYGLVHSVRWTSAMTFSTRPRPSAHTVNHSPPDTTVYDFHDDQPPT